MAYTPKTRTRTSIRKLNTQLSEMNKVIQEQFVMLRKAIFVPHEYAVREHERRQREILAAEIDVSPEIITALEKTKDSMPASVLIRLMQRYMLSTNYFSEPDAPLSSAFIAEQKALENKYLLENIQAMQKEGASIASRRINAKKGGWLKGLPRHPKTDEERTIFAIWEEAKRQGYKPTNIGELVAWGADGGFPEAEAILEKLKSSKRMRKVRSSNVVSIGRPRHIIKAGGWLKGVPRHPKNPAEERCLKIWKFTRKIGINFDNVDAMLDWWSNNHSDAEFEEPKTEEKRPAKPPHRIIKH
ncbi:MAG: hypothetical protein K6G50_08315 [bacterium]|nr:hypothetical protein [bacterium]